MQSLTIATKFENSIFTIEKTMLCSFLLQIELKGVNFSLMLFVFITYAGFQHDFHTPTSSKTDATSGATYLS
jgi:hypothetical protein